MNFKLRLFSRINSFVIVSILMISIVIAIFKADKILFFYTKYYLIISTGIFITILAICKKNKIKWVSVVVGIITGIFMLLLLLVLRIGLKKMMPGPYEDLRVYPLIFKNGEMYVEYMQHFPKEIPKNANEVIMRYARNDYIPDSSFPLEGFLCLKYKTDKDEIDQLKNKYECISEHSDSLFRTFRYLDYFRTKSASKLEPIKFDEYWKLFYSCNITNSSGIAYSEKTNEVLYWFFADQN